MYSNTRHGPTWGSSRNKSKSPPRAHGAATTSPGHPRRSSPTTRPADDHWDTPHKESPVIMGGGGRGGGGATAAASNKGMGMGTGMGEEQAVVMGHRKRRSWGTRKPLGPRSRAKSPSRGGVIDEIDLENNDGGGEEEAKARFAKRKESWANQMETLLNDTQQSCNINKHRSNSPSRSRMCCETSKLAEALNSAQVEVDAFSQQLTVLTSISTFLSVCPPMIGQSSPPPSLGNTMFSNTTDQMRFPGVQLPDQLGNVKPSQQPPFSTTFSPDQPHQLLPSPQIQELLQDSANNNVYDQESHPPQESEPNTSQPQSPQHKGRTSHTHSKKANTQPASTGSKSTKVSTPHTSKTAKSPLNTRHKDQPNSNVKYRSTNQQASSTDELLCTKEEDPALDSHSPITAKSTTTKSAKTTTRSPREEVVPESTTHTASSFQQKPALLEDNNQILDSIDLAGQLAEANLKIDKLKKRNAKLRLFIRDYLSNHVAAKDRKIRVLENRAQFLQAQMAQQQSH